MNWTTERRKLGDLKPWDKNPRRISEEQAKRLLESWDLFGQVDTIAIGPQCEVYNGHQRLSVLLAAYGPDYEIDVRVAPWELTESERKRLTIYLHKSAAGEWDFDSLKMNFAFDEMKDFGWPEDELNEMFKTMQAPASAESPTEFKEYDENIQVEHTCPRCQFSWSGGKVTKE